MTNQVAIIAYRVLFVVSIVLVGLAACEKLANMTGWTLVFVQVEPPQLLDLAVVPVLLVIALLLREIKQLLGTSRSQGS